MDINSRIAALGQEVYTARHGQINDVSGTDLTDFINETITWVNQLTREIEPKADWNMVRSNDVSLGTISTANSTTYALPDSVRKLVVHPMRPLTIKQDGTVVSSFKLVNPNQITNPADLWDIRDRATVINRNVVLSRPLKDTEIGGTVVADTIGFIPTLSLIDSSLLDILDTYVDFKQLYILGILKNQILPDIVQGGLTPNYSKKFDDMLQDLIAENNLSADTDDVDSEDLAYIAGSW